MLDRAVDSTGATIDFLLSAKRDAAAAERFLAKALSGANHPAPRVINTDKHAGCPPAIVRLKAVEALEENCRHRPVQYLNNVLEQDSPGHQTPGARKPTFSFILGSLAYDRRLRGDSYDPQRPSVLECGGCEGWSTAPLHSRSVRRDELNFRSSTPSFGSTTKLQHIRMEARLKANPEILGQRRELVEHPFGSIKQWMNQGAFLMRGLEKVRAEFSLTALAYNMTRVLTIVGIE